MTILTQDEIDEVTKTTCESGGLGDWSCRIIVFYMIGYLSHATDIEDARQAFFNQVKSQLIQDQNATNK
jgi:hypothetical protein